MVSFGICNEYTNKILIVNSIRVIIEHFGNYDSFTVQLQQAQCLVHLSRISYNVTNDYIFNFLRNANEEIEFSVNRAMYSIYSFI